uniref:40S ribosomal protein S3a n=1 Tax=Nannospalax galili TaxID=1026970 RepID=A0A8C6QKC3_NANGA
IAVGKNKYLTKGSEKGAKKKLVDPLSMDWYDVKAPAMFNIRNIGKTLVTRTQGTKIASDGLKGRVFEVSLADLQNDEAASRKFKLITEDVQGKNCLTSMAWILPGTKCLMVTCFACSVLFLLKKRNNQTQKTSYAQHQQVEVQTKDLKEVVNKLIPDSIGKDIEKTCQSIYPLHEVFISKVKMLKKPNHSGKAAGDETGAKVERADGYEPPVQESV